MGDSPTPSDATDAGPGRLQFIKDWAQIPIAAIIGAVASLLTVWFTHTNTEQQYNSAFEKLLQDTITAPAVSKDPQVAAMTLLAMQDVAQTRRQKETVLLIAARMLHSSSNPSATAPAARALAVMLNDDQGDKDLPAVIDSKPFFALVMSGYATSYFDDSTASSAKLMATVQGDSPLTSEPEVFLLDELGGKPPHRDGWIHLATFSTRYRYGVAPKPTQWPPPTPDAKASHAPAVVAAQTAVAFVADMVKVAHGDLSDACNVRAQYAVSMPASSAPPLPMPTGASRTSPSSTLPPCAPPQAGVMPPLIGPSSWVSPAPYPTSLLVLAPRLLRDAPPVVMVNPDGTFMRGTLGHVRGVIPAGTCIDVVDEGVRPVLVFVEEQYLRGKASAKADPNHWTGLIHLWAHVAPSRAGCAFPTPEPAQ